MTERISLSELREFVGRFDEGFLPSQVGRDDVAMLCESLPALVEAVEAAHAVIESGALVIHQEWADAEAALEKFDFGGRP